MVRDKARLFLAGVLAASVLGIWVGPAAWADALVIEDFEDVSDWTGLSLETNLVQVGNGAGRWSDTVGTTSIRRSFDPPLDLSGRDHIGFWLYSAQANGAGLQLVFMSNSDATSGPDYYSKEIVLDWEGWRWFWLSKDELSPSRSPLGWDQIQYIQISASGWGHEPAADTDLVFDQLLAANAVVANVVRRHRWDGSDFLYEYELTLRERDGAAVSLDLSVDAPSDLQVAVDPAHVDLAAHGTTTVSVTVRIPGGVITQQGPYHLWDTWFMVTSQAGATESWREMVATPGEKADPPRSLLTREDFDRISSWAQSHAWAASLRDSIVARADSWPQTFEERYGLSHWALPTEGGQWTAYYVCPVHGVTLQYEPPMTHRCPVDGATYSGWPYDQVIYSRQHGDLAKAVRDLALAWQFTGQLSYAQAASEILLAYADVYESYPIHDKDGGTGESGARVRSQTLDESGWLISMAWAYDMILDSGVLGQAQREHIEQDLLEAAASVILRHDAGKSNWQAWHNAGIAAAGRAAGDPTLVARAINGRHGFFYHMAESVTSDGFWYEGSWGYHFYTLSALTYLAELGKRAGLDLFADPSLRAMYLFPVEFAPPDMVLPAFNDSHELDLRAAGRNRMEVAYGEYGDEHVLLALAGTSRPEWGLFWGAEDIPSDMPSPLSSSVVFPESGYAIMRGGTPDDPWWAALDFGPHGGWHGHYDKLGFVLYARGKMLGLDPGSHSYALSLHDTWDRSTVAHDTVAIDEQVQNAATGELERFVAMPSLVWARANAGGAGAPAAMMTRDLVMADGYVLDRFTVDATDGQSHRADWFWHAQGVVSTDDLTLQPYGDLPSDAGYQHLEGAMAADSDQDVRFLFAWDGDTEYPGRVWPSDSNVDANQAYDGSQVHSGNSALRIDYGFSGADPSAYILFMSRSMMDFREEAPNRISLWVYGDGSGNSFALRILDDTGESHVCPATSIDFTGWRQISFDVDDSWSHWSGNDDGVIDLPLSRVVFQLNHGDGGASTGSLWLDDWRLTFPDAGELVAEDYERLSARTRIWVAGQPGSTYVTAQGIGPDLQVPVDCFFVRRTGSHIAFDVLHEPHGREGPQVSAFAVLEPEGDFSADAAAGYRVETAEWVDHLVMVGRGDGGTERPFGQERFATDGVLAWSRTTVSDDSPLLRLALAEGTSVTLDGRELFTAQRILTAAAFSVLRPLVRVDALDGDLTDARLLAPGTEQVTYLDQPVDFEMDGDYVVFGRLTGHPDGGVEDGGSPEGDAGLEGDGGESGSGSDSGCGCRGASSSQGTFGIWGLLLLTLLVRRHRERTLG